MSYVKTHNLFICSKSRTHIPLCFINFAYVGAHTRSPRLTSAKSLDNECIEISVSQPLEWIAFRRNTHQKKKQSIATYSTNAFRLNCVRCHSNGRNTDLIDGICGPEWHPSSVAHSRAHITQLCAWQMSGQRVLCVHEISAEQNQKKNRDKMMKIAYQLVLAQTRTVSWSGMRICLKHASNRPRQPTNDLSIRFHSTVHLLLVIIYEKCAKPRNVSRDRS